MTKPTKIIKEYSTHTETLNAAGKLHSFNDQPSISYTTGVKAWHKNGLLHRDGNKPAYIGSAGENKFYQNGVEVNSTSKAAALQKIKEYDSAAQKMIDVLEKYSSQIDQTLRDWTADYRKVYTELANLTAERNRLATTNGVSFKYNDVDSVDDALTSKVENHVYIRYNSSNC